MVHMRAYLEVINIVTVIFLLKERSDGGGTISPLFGSMYVCMSVT